MKALILLVCIIAITFAIIACRNKTENDSPHLQVGRLLFPAQREEFAKFFTAFEKDKKKFLSENKTLLNKYTNEGIESLKAFDILYVFADTHKLTGSCDWRGEEDPGELEKYIEGILKRKIAWTATQKLRSTATDEHDGHFIIDLFIEADKDLQVIDQRLIFFQLGTDSYCYTTISAKDFETVVTKLPDEFEGMGRLRK